MFVVELTSFFATMQIIRSTWHCSKVARLVYPGPTNPFCCDAGASFLRPTKELIAKDEGFVQLAQERGWKTSRVVRKTDAGPAFPEDGGDLAIRSTVHGFKLIPPQRDAQT